jgi:hypothetical protein
MNHEPETCTICLRNDRLRYDSEGEFHFVPHDSDPAFPLFKLYPIVAER